MGCQSQFLIDSESRSRINLFAGKTAHKRRKQLSLLELAKDARSKSKMKIPLNQLVCFGFCDPASGKQVIKRVRARSAIIVVGADPLNRVFVLYAWAGRPSTPQLLKRLIEVGEKFPRLKRFGIEANAMQELFADLVANQAREMKKRIPFIPVMQPTKIEKNFRIRTTLQPLVGMENGRLFIQENQTELKTEIITFPVARRWI